MSRRSRNLGQLVKAIHIAEQNLTLRINHVLAPLALNRSQLSVLACFSNQPNRIQTISSLVSSVELKQPAVTKIVSYLIEQGWLEHRPDPDDARRRALKITPAGLGIVFTAYSALTPVVNEVFESLDDDEMVQLTRLLNRSTLNRSVA